MGCRPSRRAAVCVRVAGPDGPWGVGRSSRPISTAGGVTLRDRNNGGRAAVNPQGRYSAPPTDAHFPPHSSTTATYHHGCCGRSRITLRLSNNGSTLEIETTEFQENDKTCHLCSADEGAATSTTDSVPLRSQSAPCLTTFIRDDIWYFPFSSPPPVVRRATGGGRRLFSGDRVGSGTGSVRTATAVDVEVQNNICVLHNAQEAAAAASDLNLPVDVDHETEDAGATGENLNNGTCVSEKENSSSGVESEIHDGVDNSVIQPQCSHSQVTGFTSVYKDTPDMIVFCKDSPGVSTVYKDSPGVSTICKDTPEVSASSASDRPPSRASTLDRSSKSSLDKSTKAEDSPSFLHSLRSGAKAKIDSPKTILKAVCHKSTDSLKKAWCHITSDPNRVASSAASVKWDRQSDESTDTGCESDEEDRIQLLTRLEIGPTYVHTDFRNDFEDLFDDSSPDLEKS